MKKITIRTIDWSVLVLNIFCVIIPLFFVVLITYSIHNTTIQTVFIISSISILGGLNYLLIKKKSYLVDFIFNIDNIKIYKNDDLIFSCNYDEIINYNQYYFINKRGGYILRLKSKSESYCALLTWMNFDKANQSDYEVYDYFKNEFDIKLPFKKKMGNVDYLLKLVSISPYIALILALITLIGIFIYITSI